MPERPTFDLSQIRGSLRLVLESEGQVPFERRLRGVPWGQDPPTFARVNPVVLTGPANCFGEDEAMRTLPCTGSIARGARFP